MATVPRVKVTVSNDGDVTLGSTTLLKCQYTGVRNASKLVVKWEHRVDVQSSGVDIWTYDGSRAINSAQSSYKGKFEVVDSVITHEHVIRLKKAELADEGSYSCMVEYYGGGEYSDHHSRMLMTILGML